MVYYIIYIVYLFSSVLLSNELTFNTLWGNCTFINQSNSLSSKQITQIINLEIQKMYNTHGPIPINNFTILREGK